MTRRKSEISNRLTELESDSEHTPLSELSTGALYLLALRQAYGEASRPDASAAWDEYCRRVGGAPGGD